MSIGSGWAESRLKEHCNEYVDHLSEKCINIWSYLSQSPLQSDDNVLFIAWKHVAESGFLTLLEGFSKIYHCSTEGRALMSIDLASYSSGISKRAMKDRLEDSTRLPPPPATNRGMQYVDMYVKVFYFPANDMLEWISENRSHYHLNHLLTLVSFGAHNQLPYNELANYAKKRDQILAL